MDLLREFYGSVFIPIAVADELRAGLERGLDVPVIETIPWIIKRDCHKKAGIDSTLGAGEIEAIQLATESKARLIILDDLLARRTALKQGLAVTGTLGILVKAYRGGLIDNMEDTLYSLREKGMWISAELIIEVLKEIEKQD